MNMLKKYKLLLAVSIISIIVLSFSGAVYALNTWDTGYQINTETKEVYVGSAQTCYKVKNTSGISYFIPTKTDAEWNSFSSYKPAGISIFPCDWSISCYCWAPKICTSGNDADTRAYHKYEGGVHYTRSTMPVFLYDTGWVSGNEAHFPCPWGVSPFFPCAHAKWVGGDSSGTLTGWITSYVVDTEGCQETRECTCTATH